MINIYLLFRSYGDYNILGEFVGAFNDLYAAADFVNLDVQNSTIEYDNDLNVHYKFLDNVDDYNYSIIKIEKVKV